MSASATKPVLIIGGAGIVGALTTRTLRRLQPGLPITIGGRDLAKAETLAREVGHADATRIDLERPDLGQPDTREYGAVTLFVKDETLNTLSFAQARGVPYLSLSDGTFEIGPTVARYIHQPQRAAILMASHWLAGAALFPTLQIAASFAQIDAVDLFVVLDEQDMGGPAAFADYMRITTAAPNALIVRDGAFQWVGGADAARSFIGIDGVETAATAYSPLDIVSLSAATGARAIRMDLALGESASRRRGEPFSTEIIIEIAGTLKSGSHARVRHELVHPQGQAPLTALGVALGLERLLGLQGGPPVSPGLHLPDTLIDPAYFVSQLNAFGTRIREVKPRHEMQQTMRGR